MVELLQVKDLNIELNKKTLVKNVSFTISESQIFSVVGQSGSGKSLTALSILQLSKFLANFNISGEINFAGQNLLNLPEKQITSIRGSEISMIFQDPMTSLNPLHTIGGQISEAIRLHQAKLSNNQVKDRVLELLRSVELSELNSRLDAYPHQLSGGQRQRIMIAIALANNPKLIIADEPTTALDVTVQQEILKLLLNLKKDKKISILLITHDLTIVKNIADYVVVMNKGEIVEKDKTHKVFASPKHEYTKLLLASEPKGLPSRIIDNIQLLESKSLNIKYTIGKNFFGFSKEFFTAVKNADFILNKGQTLGIVGESGSGKSSIAKALVRLIQSEGEVQYLNQNIIRISSKDFMPLKKHIQIVFQDPYSSLNPRMTVNDIIKEGLDVHFPNLLEVEKNQMVRDKMSAMNLDESYLHRYPHELSGGEKQRVGIARSLILKPDILILDEPTSALDLITQSEILEILKKLQVENGLSYIFISHDLRVIKSISHYIIVMKNGIIVEQGTGEDIFDKPKETYTKRLIAGAFLNNEAAKEAS
jgi:microcin C transport system ATP-binding protein